MKVTKKEIARRQIDTAIELFFEARDFVSITTLAGAGEEIMGSLLRRVGKVSMMDHLADVDKRRTGPTWDSKAMNAVANGIRNNLKHATNPDEDEIETGFDYMISMLARAVANYTSLDHDPTPLMLKFSQHLLSQYPELSSQLILT